MVPSVLHAYPEPAGAVDASATEKLWKGSRECGGDPAGRTHRERVDGLERFLYTLRWHADQMPT
jgi:hypothetical protein